MDRKMEELQPDSEETFDFKNIDDYNKLQEKDPPVRQLPDHIRKRNQEFHSEAEEEEENSLERFDPDKEEAKLKKDLEKPWRPPAPLPETTDDSEEKALKADMYAKGYGLQPEHYGRNDSLSNEELMDEYPYHVKMNKKRETMKVPRKTGYMQKREEPYYGRDKLIIHDEIITDEDISYEKRAYEKAEVRDWNDDVYRIIEP
jgi:hypothetical protein